MEPRLQSIAWTCFRTFHRLHQHVSLYVAIERPVLSFQSRRDLGLCLKRLIHKLPNSSSTGVTKSSPTWSCDYSILHVHCISRFQDRVPSRWAWRNKYLQGGHGRISTFKVSMATPLLDARSLIAANSFPFPGWNTELSRQKCYELTSNLISAYSLHQQL